MPNTIEGYAPFAVFIVLLVGLGIGMLGASRLLGPSKPGRIKVEPWECGVDPLQASSRDRFAVPFYLVAILFILFDLETVFLFPWAVVVKSPDMAGMRGTLFLEVFAFVLILALGLVYVWRRRGLEWD